MAAGADPEFFRIAQAGAVPPGNKEDNDESWDQEESSPAGIDALGDFARFAA